MEPVNKIKYDGAYLERYRNGALSAKEAHALEKASLEDPLLSEALEGFHQSNRSSKPELQFLKEWVNERVDENQAAIRLMPKNSSYAPLLQVAAVFLLLIGAAWIAYIFWVAPTQPTLADNRTTNTHTITSATLPDTALPVPTQTTTTTSSQSSENLIPTALPTAPSIPEPKPLVQAAAEPVQKEAELPLSVSDAVTESVPKEIVVTPSPERENARAAIKQQLLVKDAAATDAPAPLGGWNAYEDYLERNREAAPTASNTNANPVVVLSFAIGNDGRPTDIKVERSAGTFYDEKATDLLKKGPGWLPGLNGKRAELRVRF